MPALWKDKAETTDYVVASGRGTVFSFVVHHAPRVPGRSLPFVVALVELEEGVRMLGELRDVDPSEVVVACRYSQNSSWTSRAMTRPVTSRGRCTRASGEGVVR